MDRGRAEGAVDLMHSWSRRRVLALMGGFAASALALKQGYAQNRQFPVHRLRGDCVIVNGWVLALSDLDASHGEPR